ncbi:FAD-binding oxidoreductase [Rubrobacter taiwanensis]|uniref:D-amino-acid oxidase n=1 Tax=Rubrobacter taiwanensis TaxID=185139 RepID=A0A4R1B9U5_9ACTN|nr:FAD-dependent oxidoreductase [Rubrobacter taiwanensis]TCJ13668.1 FAD-binding oxidoreductase [Rubrobacter taiwanensis]
MDALVIGCGVIGLSTAICLQEAGLEVEVWAAEMPRESTSGVAAAVWYPYKAYPQNRVLKWGGQTYAAFEKLAGDGQTGVRMGEGVELWRREVPDPWWKDAVSRFRRCEEHELPPGYRDGYVFTVPVIEMPRYLQYLLERFAGAGGRLTRRVVRSLEEAAEASPLVFNCTGLGARELVGDRLLSPIRGQIVRVRNPGLERFVLDEEHPEEPTYIVPRTEDCVLGGTAQERRWDIEPDPETAAAILRRCVSLEPRLADAEVLEHRVGLRPGRPEVRLEREELGSGALCVHNYGHGGAGVTLSWGCAREACALVLERIG